MFTQMAAQSLKSACRRHARRTALWVVNLTEDDESVGPDETIDLTGSIDAAHEVDLDRRFDSYLNLDLEDDASRSWFTT